MTAVYDHVRGLSIQWVARRIELFEPGQRIGNVQQGSISIMTCTLVEQDWRHIQVDHPSGVMKPAAVLRIDDNATASRQHDTVNFGERLNGLRFPTAKSFLSLDFEDGRDRNASPLDNLVIGIKKRSREALGQLAPDSRFAGAH